MKTISIIFLFIVLLTAAGCNKGEHSEIFPLTHGLAGIYLTTAEHYSYTAAHDHDTSIFVYPDTLYITTVSDSAIRIGDFDTLLFYYTNTENTTFGYSTMHNADLAIFYKNNPDSITYTVGWGGGGSGGGIRRQGRKIN